MYLASTSQFYYSLGVSPSIQTLTTHLFTDVSSSTCVCMGAHMCMKFPVIEGTWSVKQSMLGWIMGNHFMSPGRQEPLENLIEVHQYICKFLF